MNLKHPFYPSWNVNIRQAAKQASHAEHLYPLAETNAPMGQTLVKRLDLSARKKGFCIIYIIQIIHVHDNNVWGEYSFIVDL